MDGRLLCDWTVIASVLQKKELSAEELTGLCDVLDQIAKLPEQKRNAMANVLMNGCKIQSGALEQFIEAYLAT